MQRGYIAIERGTTGKLVYVRLDDRSFNVVLSQV
jgi:hypothetical protein